MSRRIRKYALILPVAEVFEIVWLELIGVHNEKNIGKHCKQKKKSKKCFKLNSLHSMIEMLGQNWQKYFDIFEIFYGYFFT